MDYEKKIAAMHHTAGSHSEKECSSLACKLMKHNPLKWSPGAILYRSLEKVYDMTGFHKSQSLSHTSGECCVEKERYLIEDSSLTEYIAELNPFKYCPETLLHNLTEELYDKYSDCEVCKEKYHKRR